ncbi:hypothetical protein, partial [Klebsiella pneumoniae]|uniref:hypothetical protein n=1 Tax=Klebsiella pneumoniae TaxID=573 RepID=UPI003F7A2D9F
LWSGSPPDTRGRSPVRKSRTPGSVRGVSGNGYPYRDNEFCYMRGVIFREKSGLFKTVTKTIVFDTLI